MHKHNHRWTTSLAELERRRRITLCSTRLSTSCSPRCSDCCSESDSDQSCCYAHPSNIEFSREQYASLWHPRVNILHDRELNLCFQQYSPPPLETLQPLHLVWSGILQDSNVLLIWIMKRLNLAPFSNCQLIDSLTDFFRRDLGRIQKDLDAFREIPFQTIQFLVEEAKVKSGLLMEVG